MTIDWKYLLSLTPEDLHEDEKEELFNTVAWFECSIEEIDLEKCMALLKVSQEILKYKKEQVETLLHELEEMAIRQGEEEAKRLESDTDARSSRSRRSSSIELENLEQKYTELRMKYKKAAKNSEKYKIELDKANNKIRHLERENVRLQNEIESRLLGASSESDVSETIKDQHKELVETIHNKNKQISDLLQDIEEVEKENLILRDKLSSVRDQLAIATKEITNMTDILKSNEAALEEKEESRKNISTQYESLTNDFEQLKQEKETLRQEMEEFAAEVDARVEEWKKILEEKDREIQDLKSHVHKTSAHSSLSSLPYDDMERSQINALQRVLSEREQKLMELQTQLQVATKEMEESTEVLKKLKSEREHDTRRINELTGTVEEVKKQLKSVHGRCQSLQEELAYVEKAAADKDTELKEILGKMKENGQVDLVVKLEEMQELRADNRVKEKQVITLVKACNKLQDSCDVLEKENDILRDKLGIPDDDQLTLSGYTTKQKKQRKELEALKKQVNKTEEEKLDLKSEIHKLNSAISSLTNQILDLGHKPKYDNIQTNPSTDWDLKKENKTLVDENEALRKGMHEILNSINVKRETSLKEIKSETLEQLLRALDVKHISGWYHPAMRLQAELHNLEGINVELRERLREARIDLERHKSTEGKTEVETAREEDRNEIEKSGNELVVEEKDEVDVNVESVDGEVVLMENLGAKDLTEDGVRGALEELFKKVQKNSKKVTDHEGLFVYFEEQHDIIRQRILRFFTGLLKEKAALEEDLNTLKDKFNLADMKLKVLEENEADQEKWRKIEEIVTNNVSLARKVTYLETETNKLATKMENSARENVEAELRLAKEISQLTRINKTLENDVRVLKNLNEMSVKFEVHKQTKKDLDNMTIKYRELAATLKEENEARRLEIQMLQESQSSLETDKTELKTKLAEVLSKLTIQNADLSDDNLERLSHKLAEVEVNELTERQRANHTNNLYELVKEQLHKSEERFREFSKYNEDLLKKNLILQEQLKQAEDDICDCVDRSRHEQLLVANNELLTRQGEMAARIAQLEEDLKLAKGSFDDRQMWNNCKQQELLHLKHQIVDLISVSDEKLIIAQLHSDLFHCKQSESFYRANLDEAADELKAAKEELGSCGARYKREKLEAKERESLMKKKVGILQNLLSKQKQQYIGCVPLCSEEVYLENLKNINKERHETFLNLHKIKTIENDVKILKEQLEMELQSVAKQKKTITEGDKEEIKNVLNWMQEKKILQINELRYRRQSEFKETQLDHFKERIRIQDEQLAKLDEELLQWLKSIDTNIPPKETAVQKVTEPTKPPSPTPTVTRAVDVQTDEVIANETINANETNQVRNLKSQLTKLNEKLEEKETHITQSKNRMVELEMAISLFRKQIGDKQSQIAFYERHILELQNKREEVHDGGAGGDNINVGLEAGQSNNDEILALKATIKTLQEGFKVREEQIIKYQTLLKADRDKHSLAAARLQEELQNLQKSLGEEKEKCLSLEETFAKARPNRAAIEQYMTQVHALEKHTAELHTRITSLEAQLQSSRQETVRWRSLANDRLAAMEELRNSLEEQHKNELSIYKTDSEKLKELGNDEINHLKQLITRHRSESTGHLDVDIERLVKEKDDKIHELTVKLRLVKNEIRRAPAGDRSDSEASPKLGDLEASKELLQKENELLKKRYEQVLNKERSARDEIRELKAQLLKKPSATRTDRTDKSIKDQLQRKISSLENEVADLKHSLADQAAITETHRVQASEDFEKWKKTKHWQQTAEKLKNKLKERDADVEKLQHTCSGYRMLIERLEREKHNLENRIKVLKNNAGFAATSKEMEMLRIENMKLMADVEALGARLEMQQRHSGALGAAMMQEKLEGQERKIAVLELTTKGSVEVRAELERLQETISSLQKANLCLEAENLDFKLDLEKWNKEVPRLNEQIQHLESYIDVLKNENAMKELGNAASLPSASGGESKKASELERTVFMLKRVVEKLQAENKRLVTGKRPLSDRAVSADKLKRENARLKEKLGESVGKISQLQEQLVASKGKANKDSNRVENDNVAVLSEELANVREQLEQKSHLLDKVKVLLHRAASKEKALLQEIHELRCQRDVGISPIQEESEDSSDL